MPGRLARVLALPLVCCALQVVAAEAQIHRTVSAAPGAGAGEGVEHLQNDPESARASVHAASADESVRQSFGRRLMQLAQFQLPPAPAAGAAPKPLPQRLVYQYAIGSESDIVYRRNPDLDHRVRDDTVIAAPQLNGYITYRPSDRLEMTLEMILEQEIGLLEESVVPLPNGELLRASKRRLSLAVDQAFARYRVPAKPLEFWVGRVNFEDDLHWLYDTSLDVAMLRFRAGEFQFQTSTGRKDLVDGDFLRHVPRTRIDNHMLAVDYRGFEEVKLGAFYIVREDRSGREGNPHLFGINALRIPSPALSYWAVLSGVRGTDPAARRYSGYAFDVGGTYRFVKTPHIPNFTLGYAFASGDGDPNDSRNHEFRQTDLQSNERRLAGVAKFKFYGEALDPELSNVGVFTAGVGFFPTPSTTVDLVFHQYRLDKIADEIRNWGLTAQMAQVDARLSRDVGKAFDVVVGLRNLFGYRRLGLDLRAGWFFPGKAFLRNDGDDDNPDIRRADKAFSAIAKFWWVW